MKKMLWAGWLLLSWSNPGLTQGAGNNSLLWKIQFPGVNEASYLFGTIHLPQKKFVVYSDSVYAAISASDRFYNEVDFLHQMIYSDTSMLAFLQEKGRHVDSLRKTDSWKRFIDRINRAYKVDLSYDDPDDFINFSQQLLASTFQPEERVQVPDMMLAVHATLLGKKTGGLETMRLQYSMMFDLLDARLNDTTMGLEDENALMNRLKDYYVTESGDSIAQIIEGINPTYRQLVFDGRNTTMSDSIAQHARERSSFFAIGAGHLFGSRGVIECLRKKGAVVSPVFSTQKISIVVVDQLIREALYADNDAPKKHARGHAGSDSTANEVRIGELITDEDVEEPPPPPPPPPPQKLKIQKAASVPQKPKKKP